MPQFQYEVKKGPGERSSGVIEAESQRAAVSRLREMGYFPISVEEQDEGGERDVLKQAFARVKLTDRNLFFRQFANLIESGMIITRALRTVAEQCESKAMAKVIEELRDDVQKGNPLADAMEKHPKVFSSMFCNLVRAGETGGMLEEVIWRIVEFGEKEEQLRGKARTAMVYPIFLLVIGSISIFILVSFVFPKFINIFNEFGKELPWPTRVVMGFCEFMGSWWWAVLLGLAVLASLLVSYFRSEKGRRKWDAFILHVPAARVVVQKYEMAKFARTLGTLLDNGVPVLSSLNITTDTMSNYSIKDEVSILHEGVTNGESMSDCLRHTKFFPPMVISMFAVGEESGRIGEVSKRVADVYDTEVDRAVVAMTALFEPLLIVIMGIIVGFLVIAMLLPMLTLSSVVSG